MATTETYDCEFVSQYYSRLTCRSDGSTDSVRAFLTSQGVEGVDLESFVSAFVGARREGVFTVRTGNDKYTCDVQTRSMWVTSRDRDC